MKTAEQYAREARDTYNQKVAELTKDHILSKSLPELIADGEVLWLQILTDAMKEYARQVAEDLRERASDRVNERDNGFWYTDDVDFTEVITP